ncbi:MAG: hypothetical protein R3E50_02820 [Halioglobus sp.]
MSRRRRGINRSAAALALASLLVPGCVEPLPQPAATEALAGLQAEPWPAADRLFFNNPDTPRFKGADVANSVALDGDRVLWVFGDTLVAEPGANACDRFDNFGILVHNSLALQEGTNPTTARIRHFWAQQQGVPASFFAPADGEDGWYWMGGVTVVGDQLLVFLMHARAIVDAAADAGGDSSCAGLNFEMLGWDARIARITPDTPDRWQWRPVALPEDTRWHNILAGSSTALADGEFLYAWSAGPAAAAGNPVFLARWPLAAATAADLGNPQWYTDAGWRTQADLGSDAPAALVRDGNNEISVARNLWAGAAESWWWLQSSRVVNSPLCYRSGSSPVAFGACRDFMVPPELLEYPDSRLLVYAAKLHPALSGQGDAEAIATYVVNSCDLRDIQDRCDLYYPRFIKLRRRE